MAKVSGLTKADTGRALDGIIGTISQQLKKGCDIALVGFGTFSVGKRAARIGCNPATGAELKIKASKAPKFEAGKTLGYGQQ